VGVDGKAQVQIPHLFTMVHHASLGKGFFFLPHAVKEQRPIPRSRDLLNKHPKRATIHQ
jgi:hypothetical protein